MSKYNSEGVELGQNGYVLCQVCFKEVQEISRESSHKYALCHIHRVQQAQEVHMPAAPKPSAATEQTTTKRSHHKKHDAPTVKQKIAKIAREMKNVAHTPPTKGKSGAWLAEIKQAGGITKEALVTGCSAHGLGATMHVAMTGYCKQLGLLKA